MSEFDNQTPDNNGQQQQNYQQPPQQQGYQPPPQQGYQPLPQQPYAPVYSVMTPEQRSARSMAIAGMVLGILALVFCWFFWLSLPLGIVGMILSIVAIKRYEFVQPIGGEKGMAVAGLVCSIIGLLVGIILIIVVIAAVSSLPWM